MQLLTRESLNKALATVQRELEAHGLWPRVRRAEVLWCALPQWPFDMLGFFIDDSHPLAQVLGYAPGHIYIPAISMSRNIRDVLRHEYAHALAHYYPRIRRSRAFAVAFGAFYDHERRTQPRRKDCVSRYATTLPMEDFAETFMLYLRRNGTPPKRMTSKLARKWQFVAHL